MTRREIEAAAGGPRITVTGDTTGGYIETRTDLDSLDPAGVIGSEGDTPTDAAYIAAISECLDAYHAWAAAARGSAAITLLDGDLSSEALTASALSIREALAAMA